MIRTLVGTPDPDEPQPPFVTFERTGSAAPYVALSSTLTGQTFNGNTYAAPVFRLIPGPS